jgi:hypothetical protein
MSYQSCSRPASSRAPSIRMIVSQRKQWKMSIVARSGRERLPTMAMRQTGQLRIEGLGGVMPHDLGLTRVNRQLRKVPEVGVVKRCSGT